MGIVHLRWNISQVLPGVGCLDLWSYTIYRLSINYVRVKMEMLRALSYICASLYEPSCVRDAISEPINPFIFPTRNHFHLCLLWIDIP